MKVKKSIRGKKLSAKNLEYHTFKLFLQRPKKRLNARQIIKVLGVKNSKISVNEALVKLTSSGKIRHVKDEKYQLDRSNLPVSNAPEEVHEGFVDMTRSGAGYIIVESLDEDVYVAPKKMGLAMNGDRVQVTITKKGGRKIEGKITRILEHSSSQFIGNFHLNKNIGFVVPDNGLVPFDIYVNPKDQGEAQDGDKVLVKIVEWPARSGKNPIGSIERTLDPENEHELTMESILINQGFDMHFPPAVEKEARELSRKISDKTIEARRDFRGVPTFTIDPLTAKDFDDALSIQTLENGNLEIGIHIADVTHYVKPGSALDKEALRRSTSVYLVDRVAPMLPEVLSNELCSLRPDEDSLTFSAVFEFNSSKKVVNRWFGKTIIHSIKRFAYEEAQSILDANEGPFLDQLVALNNMAKHLRKIRFKQGSIAFESPEVQFELDDNNHPIAIHTKERKETHMLVEDFMLLANREVATYMAKKEQPEIPFVYRIHDLPDEEKLAEYAFFLRELGFEFKYGSAKEIRSSFARLTKTAREDEVIAFAEPLAVRTMSKAIYTTDNIGHFGLGFSYYAHFTSPIRRYADVLVHRILQQNLHGSYRPKKSELEQQCQHISNQERKAQEAERESIKFKQVEYISDHIGETMEGIISGMIDRGIFITLRESRVDGMVGFDTMDEPFRVEDSRLKAVGVRSKKMLKVGDLVHVRVTQARIDDREVDMEFVEK